MEPASFLVLAGAVVQTVGAVAGLDGFSRSGAKPPWGQFTWMQRCWRGEASLQEQQLFRKSLLFGGVGWALIIGGIVLA